MYQEKWKNYYFPQKKIDIPEKWTLLRKIGKDKLTPKAQERLEWIIFYHTVGKKQATVTATCGSDTTFQREQTLLQSQTKSYGTLSGS